MNNELARSVETTIDRMIRSLVHGDEESYAHWDAELERLELSLLEASSLPDRQQLFASLRAQRIQLAYDLDNCELVLEYSSPFVHEVPLSNPGFFSVATLRARCLHSVGAHRAEVEEVLQWALTPEIQGSEYLYFLEHLAKNHPGSIPEDDALFAKLREAVFSLRAKGYETLVESVGNTGLERLVLEAAGELRRVNRERGEALLAASS